MSTATPLCLSAFDVAGSSTLNVGGRLFSGFINPSGPGLPFNPSLACLLVVEYASLDMIVLTLSWWSLEFYVFVLVVGFAGTGVFVDVNTIFCTVFSDCFATSLWLCGVGWTFRPTPMTFSALPLSWCALSSLSRDVSTSLLIFLEKQKHSPEALSHTISFVTLNVFGMPIGAHICRTFYAEVIHMF